MSQPGLTGFLTFAITAATTPASRDDNGISLTKSLWLCLCLGIADGISLLTAAIAIRLS